MPVPTSTLIRPEPGPGGAADAAAASGVTELNSNIWVAAGEGDLDSVQHLLDTNADLLPTSPDDFSYTPVHAAASYGQIEMLDFLLTHPKAASYQPPSSTSSATTSSPPPPPRGAANVEDSDGDTPLFVCETVETARVLVEKYGADPAHRNLEGKTAAQAAYENEAFEVAEYLRSLTGEPEPVEDEEEDEDDDEDQYDEEEDDQEDGQEEGEGKDDSATGTGAKGAYLGADQEHSTATDEGQGKSPAEQAP